MIMKGNDLMKYSFKPRGICPNNIAFDVENGILKDVNFSGGCNGNLKAMSLLVRNMPVHEVIAKLEGITCGFKSTSCADQLAKALKEMV